MAVRLLVSFNKEDHRDWEALEKMVGVPAGTGVEADKLEKRIDNLRREGRYEEASELYRSMRDTDARRLYEFTYMGWGRITEEVRKVIRSFGLHTGEGRTGHPGQVQAILRFQGVSEEARGVIAEHHMILTWG